MRVLVRNLKNMECQVSPTWDATVLLMPTPSFMRKMMKNVAA